jgi:tetratricopeptide (TPR) repeat protein
MRNGDRERVTAQLIDGRTDHHLWSERYDRELRDVLDLQSDVARAVARKVDLELSVNEAARLGSRRPVDPAALDAILEGVHHFSRVTPDSLRSALTSFERAIELDPEYAPAHAWVAASWALLAGFGAVTPFEAMPKARSAALRALELDAELPSAHAQLGVVALWFDRDWPASERHLQRAMELNPSLHGPHNNYAWHLASRGRLEEAIAESRQAVALDPAFLSYRSVLAQLHWYARRYDDALSEIRKILEMDPTLLFAYRLLGDHYDFLLGRHEDGIAAYEKGGLWTPEQASTLRAALEREGPRGFWRARLPLERSRAGAQHSFLSMLHAKLDERDEAFAELEHAYASREFLAALRVHPAWDPIRDDPRFDDLVRRLGIPES